MVGRKPCAVVPSEEKITDTNSVSYTHLRGEGWYALNYNTLNANCIVWHLDTAEDSDTVITTIPVEGRLDTYYFMLRDRALYLTAVGTSLKWMTYTGEEEQMFTIWEPGTGGDGGDTCLLYTSRCV